MDFTSWDAGLHTVDGEHLEHYGVLGMKWGMRRYQNKDGSLTPRGQKHYAETGEYGYHYKSHATKKYQRKAAKAEAKGDKEKAAKYRNRAKRSSEVDKGEEEYARNISTGKAILGTLLTSGNTMKGYAQYRAMAGQKGKDITGKKLLSFAKAYRAGAYGSRLRKAAYIRQDEGGKGLGQAKFRLENKIENAAGRILPENENNRERFRSLGNVAKAGANDAVRRIRNDRYQNQQARRKKR